MTTKVVEVTRYISCDGGEFNTRSECEAHERETRNLLEHNVWELQGKKRELLCAINEARINARIAWLDARKLKPEARSAMGKSEYCKLMSDYWRFVSVYNTRRRELHELRQRIGFATDNLYMWYGFHRKKSSVARLERKKRSLAWRREHTQDQWTTPHKILVSKLPHPAIGED